MKKFTFSASLIAAIIIHIIVLVLSGIVIGDKQISFDYQNAIPVQFGNGTIKKSGNSGQTISGKSINTKESKTITLAAETNSDSTTTITQSDAGSGSSTNPGNPDGSTFESTIISYEGPAYPRVAQVRGLEGSVRLRIKVSTDGRSQSATIIKSSGHEVLDQSAMNVVPRWRFQPKETPYIVEKNIVFQLKN